MNERQLFEAIGQVDDDLILAADRPAVRRRKKPVYWMPALSVAACAGLLMVGVAGWRAGSSKNDFVESTAAAAETAPEAAAPDEPLMSAASPYADEGSSPVEGSTGGTYKAGNSAESSIAIAPTHAVMLEGVIYYDTCAISDTDPSAAPDGTITSTVDSDSFPTEDGQSNFGTGYAYRYGSEDGTLEVQIDGEWWIFAANQ